MADVSLEHDGALLFDESGILAVGDAATIQSQIGPDDVMVDAGGRLVTPGLVDCHTHAVFGGERLDDFERRIAGATYREVAQAGGGIQHTVRCTRAADQEALVEAGVRHLGWMLRTGTTTVEIKSGYALDVEGELRMLRAIRDLRARQPLQIFATFLGAHAVGPECGGANEHVAQVVEAALPQVAAEGLASACDIFVEDGYFRAEHAEALAGLAAQHGLDLHLHVDQLTERGGAQLAVRLGARSADHLEQTSDAGIRALAASDTAAVVLPGSVLALGLARYAPARAMVDAGCAVAIATDFNPGSSPLASLPLAMHLGCTQMRMSPAEVWTATTINAARALGCVDRGQLTPGQRADVVLWDADDYREVPYWLGAPIVDRVWIGGRPAFTS